MIEKPAILTDFHIFRGPNGILTFGLDFKYDDGSEHTGGMYSLGSAKRPGSALVVLIDTLLDHFSVEDISELKNIPCFVKVEVLGKNAGQIQGFRSFGKSDCLMFADIFAA